MESSIERPVIRWKASGASRQPMALLAEEPLAIRVEGRPYAVVMRTPGEEIAHVAGFCLGEGVIDRLADTVAIGLCDDENPNVVTVTLTPERRAASGAILERRNYISQSSCGICGKELVRDLEQLLTPVPDGAAVALPAALTAMEEMAGRQRLRELTRAAHAAALFDAGGGLLALAEDIGRHNALDKAVGRALMAGSLPRAVLLCLSSRVSYELVQKAARARIAAILAVSRPTELAVALAAGLNMGVACLEPEGGVCVFCGPRRFGLTEI